MQLPQLFEEIRLARAIFLTAHLNPSIVISSLILLSIFDQSTGPKYLIECFPKPVVLTLGILNSLILKL